MTNRQLTSDETELYNALQTLADFCDDTSCIDQSEIDDQRELVAKLSQHVSAARYSKTA